MVNWETLRSEAIHARELAYAPYSQFLVGAALLAKSGRIFRGCNIENASYGATNCAERTALYQAVANGEPIRSFSALAIVAETEQVLPPCGICRQVLFELCDPDMPVLLANLKGDQTVVSLRTLLPLAFEGSILAAHRDEDKHE